MPSLYLALRRRPEVQIPPRASYTSTPSPSSPTNNTLSPSALCKGQFVFLTPGFDKANEIPFV